MNSAAPQPESVVSSKTDDHSQSVALDQTTLLYQNQPLSIIVGGIIAAILAYAMKNQVPAGQLAIWCIAFAAISVGRGALWLKWRCHSEGPCERLPDATGSWRRWFMAGTCAAGLGWGTASILLFPAESIPHQVFLGFVLGSLTAGAVSTIGVHFRSYLGFILPALIPYIVRLGIEGGELQVLMATVFAIGILFLVSSARRFDHVSTSALSLKYENTRLVEALRSALQGAEEASRAKSVFLATMSHEIRTPMSGVIGMVELLQKSRLDASQRRIAGTISQSAGTLLSLINDVLDISRIEAGRLALETTDFDVRACIEDVLDLCADSSYRKGLELHLIVDQSLPSLMRGDPSRLRQVLVNLIGNAIKFTESGQITVRVKVAEAEAGRFDVDVSITDSGVGIAPASLTRLFAPFTQAEEANNRRYGGSGLGLAITRQLVSMMGGEVRLESEIGKGTTVRFNVVLEAAKTQTEEPRAVAILAGKRVLVLDDRSLSREAISSDLRSDGLRVDQACSEEEALSKLSRAAASGNPFDAIIVDRLRPRTDNVLFQRRLRALPDHAGLPIIAFMSLSRKIDPQAAPAVARSEQLLKPVRRSDLRAALERALTNDHQATDAASLPQGTTAQPRSNTPLPVVPVRELPPGLDVLLVEDNPVNQEVATAFLDGFGCKTSLAENGLEAIEAYARTRFDIVLMDCQMPEVDGLTAMRHIRSHEQTKGLGRTPIVMVTANAFASDREQALAAGADGFLSKPYSEAQLRAAMAEALPPVSPSSKAA